MRKTAIKKNMKVTFLMLILIALVGCNNPDDENKAKNVAKEFVNNLHKVDDSKIDEYRKLEELIPPGANIIGEGIPEGTLTDPNKEYTQIAESLDKDIQPFMTKEGYEKILMNRFNLLSTRVCARNNYNSNITGFTLGENLYEDNKDIDKLRYKYEANIQFNSNDGGKKLLEILEGYIELIEEDGEWKVSIYTISSYPKIGGEGI